MELEALYRDVVRCGPDPVGANRGGAADSTPLQQPSAGQPAGEPADNEEDLMELPPSEPIEGLDVERLDMLRDLDPGSTAYLDRAIGNFLTNTGPAVERIRAAAGSGDAHTMRQAAHKLVGSALNLGVLEVGAAARELELLGDAGTTAGSEGLLPALDRAVEQGRELLRRYHASYSSDS